MGSIRKAMASMLAVLALTAFMSDAGAQTRRSSDVNRSTPARQSSSRSSSSSKARPSSSQTRKSASASQNRQSNDNKKAVNRQSARPSAPAARPDSKPSSSKPASGQKPADKPDFKPGDQNKPVQVTRPSSDRKPNARPGHGPGKPVQIRPDHRPEPPRVHPRERDFMHWDRPSRYWSPNRHYYGYRVRVLPSYVVRHIYNGITYYCYNDIWYRPYGGYYVVCRPPYGLSLAANIISDIAWTAVRLSYYNTVADTYSQINENNAYIAEQNAIIAQNNAAIAAQNASIAQNQQLAQTAYTLANELGLIQSYAAANSEYFYQDGVFYAKDASGEYRTILPPAGALVETLPEDFEMVTLKDGNEYYKVDDTVYKVTVSDGKPYFEVLGQLYQ